MKFNLLKQKDFLLLMLGKLVSLFGSDMQSFALSLYVLKITGSATQFAGILSITLLPQIILGPFVGVFVDWFDRKKIVVSLDMFNGMLIGIYAVMFMSSGKLTLTSIYVLAVILSMVSLMFQPAITTVIPSIMKKDEIPDANAINSLVLSIGQLAAPTIAGILFGFSGLGLILIINSLSFVCSSISETFINIPKSVMKKEKVNFKAFKNDFVEGVSFIKKKQLIFAILFLCLVVNFACAPIASIGLAFVTKEMFKVSDYQYGMLQSVICVAMIAAPLFIGKINEKIHVGKIVYLAITIVGILSAVTAVIPSEFYMGLFASSFGPYISFTVLIFLICFVISIVNVEFSIVMQTEVPLELMGRVGTVSSSMCMAAMPLGQMIFGILFDTIPAWTCYVITAAIFVFSALLFKNKLIGAKTESVSTGSVNQQNNL